MKPTATFRSQLGDFVVDEIPAYLPSGVGAHAYLRVRKTDLTTFECIARLARAIGVPPRDVGHAGMKDRFAITTQYLSFPFSENDDLGRLEKLELPGIEILEVSRHGNKLRPGHLEGNRFRIVLREVPPDCVDELDRGLLDALQRGFPNAFGPQRFGRDGTNPERTLAWLRGETRGPRDPRMARLLFSSVQSWLFDLVLRTRVEQGSWCTVMLGDVVKKRDTGGLFDCSDEATDSDRALRGEVSATGPIFGAEMRWPTGRPAELENAVLLEHLADPSLLARFRKLGAGSRRVLRVFPAELRVTRLAPDTLETEFVLPKGVYATTLLGLVCELRDAHRVPTETDRPPETSVHDELLYDPGPTSE